MTLDNILEEINKANKIVILTHENPDGDAVGSSLAMKLALKQLGKDADLIMPEHPKEFDFLPEIDEIKKESDVTSYDLAISLDCGSIKQLNGFASYFDNAKVKVAIDHHSSNSMFADYNYVDQEAPACAQLLLVVFGYLNIEVTKDIGSCILSGIITDTGGFRYDSVTAETFRFVADLCEKGINVSKIYQQVLSTKTKSKFELHKIAQDRLEFLENEKIAFTYITKQDETDVCANNGDQDGIVEIGRDVEGVEISIFIRETDKGMRASLRSKSYVNVAEIAMMFGGGGHVHAAACTIQGNLEHAKQQLLNRAKVCLK